jgi:hypothetical protein
MEETKEKEKRVTRKFSKEDDELLRVMIAEGIATTEIAKKFPDRSLGSIYNKVHLVKKSVNKPSEQVKVKAKPEAVKERLKVTGNLQNSQIRIPLSKVWVDFQSQELVLEVSKNK